MMIFEASTSKNTIFSVLQRHEFYSRWKTFRHWQKIAPVLRIDLKGNYLADGHWGEITHHAQWKSTLNNKCTIFLQKLIEFSRPPNGQIHFRLTIHFPAHLVSRGWKRAIREMHTKIMWKIQRVNERIIVLSSFPVKESFKCKSYVEQWEGVNAKLNSFSRKVLDFCVE